MCGIIGIFNYEQATIRLRRGMELTRQRGEDAVGWTDGKTVSTSDNYSKFLESLKSRKNILAHALYAIVGHCPQPLQGKGVIVANCEIYNWKELTKKYNINAKNDAGLLLAMFDSFETLEPKNILPFLKEINGDYALAYWRDDQLIIARDLIGVKPLWYTRQDGLAFASEKKALLNAGYSDVREFSPRRLGIYDLKTDKLKMVMRSFYDNAIISTKSEEDLTIEVKEKIINAVKRRLPNKKIKVGILFSGGIDSTILAKICQDEGVDFTCYTSVVDNPNAKDPHDLTAAKEVATRYQFKHKIITATEDDIPSLAKKIVEEIEESHAVKVAVGMPFYLAAEQAKHDGCRVILSGLGAEEIFAGYQRHRDASDVNNECLSGLRMLYERDLYRDDVITMRQGIELRVPFLDKELIKYALTVPAKYKIHENVEKYILRKASQLLGLFDEDAFRPKKAAQYGSHFDKALQKVAKQHGLSRSAYLKTLSSHYNQKLGALCSGGKDSWFSTFVMHEQNYPIACLLTMRSSNEESYMFHTSSLDIVKLQSEASGIPLLEKSTFGEKEKELDDLKALLKQAKEEYKIDGIATGALFSQYQRERIEKVADIVGLKVFSPLWHLNQETEIKELINNNFSFVMSEIAADGLSKDWLGKPINEKEFEKLILLRDKLGANIAGEGGEYESLVLDCPLFTKKIVLKKTDIVVEGEHNAKLIVHSAELSEKEQKE